MKIIGIPSVLLALLGFGSVAFTQDSVKHAPSIEQCKADRAVWFSKLQLSVGTGATGKLDEGIDTLLAWQDEMGECMEVDKQNRALYINTLAGIRDEMGIRYMHFIERHHLSEQFNAEDAAGNR
jgi:hypothetical protein